MILMGYRLAGTLWLYAHTNMLYIILPFNLYLFYLVYLVTYITYATPLWLR